MSQFLHNDMGDGTTDCVPNNGTFFIIVYPCGDRSKLCVAEAQDFDMIDYESGLASRYWFYEMKNAIEYASDLAKKNNLHFLNQSNFLD